MKIFDAIAVGFLLALSVNLTIIFFLAAAGSGVVLVTVNTCDEQAIETILFPLWTIMGIVVFVRTLRRMR